MRWSRRPQQLAALLAIAMLFTVALPATVVAQGLVELALMNYTVRKIQIVPSMLTRGTASSKQLMNARMQKEPNVLSKLNDNGVVVARTTVSTAASVRSLVPSRSIVDALGGSVDWGSGRRLLDSDAPADPLAPVAVTTGVYGFDVWLGGSVRMVAVTATFADANGFGIVLEAGAFPVPVIFPLKFSFENVAFCGASVAAVHHSPEWPAPWTVNVSGDVITVESPANFTIDAGASPSVDFAITPLACPRVPPTPLNSVVPNIFYTGPGLPIGGSVAVAECHHGYTSEPPIMRCHCGQWTEPSPKECQPVCVDPPADVDDIVWGGAKGCEANTVVGTNCLGTCTGGKAGSPRVYCASGHFTTTLGRCVESHPELGHAACLGVPSFSAGLNANGWNLSACWDAPHGGNCTATCSRPSPTPPISECKNGTWLPVKGVCS